MRIASPSHVYSEAEFVYGAYESDVASVIEKLVRPGMAVGDLGAHIGYFTLLMAKLVGASGKVYAFEPDPANYALLVENIALNGYHNIVPIQAAVADKAGEATLFLDKAFSGSHSLYSQVPGVSKEAVTVETTTLDLFFEREGWPRIHAVKMDIEGAEPAALAGMKQLLGRNPGLHLIIEANPLTLKAAGFSSEEFLEQLAGLGLRVQVIDPKGGKHQELTEEVHRRLARIGGNLLCTARGFAASKN
ncbi:MAG: FkbM family methyltransferase [Chloroflexi bacterium]|nr:FkbM family methyltransferase [Chloroflexota bacterium]